MSPTDGPTNQRTAWVGSRYANASKKNKEGKEARWSVDALLAGEDYGLVGGQWDLCKPWQPPLSFSWHTRTKSSKVVPLNTGPLTEEKSTGIQHNGKHCQRHNGFRVFREAINTKKSQTYVYFAYFISFGGVFAPIMRVIWMRLIFDNATNFSSRLLI